MKKIAAAALATITLLSAGNASAASFAFGTYGVPGAGEKMFADYDTLNPTLAAQSKAQIMTTMSSGTGTTVDGTAYLSILAGGFATYAFGPAGISSFSFDASTIDSYNMLSLAFLDGTFQSFSGAGYTGPIKARAQFTADPGQRIAGITFASSGNSFEIDNLAVSAAVPEPATWALMILGFGVVGAAMRRRKPKLALA
jgi:hypothetical protein